MQIIKSIRIKYFRSILNTTRGNIIELPTKELNIIVGSNDAGKSNYLRALNLFFNNESELGISFDFWKNYSNQRHGVRREENRIEIELVISPPRKQFFKNKGDVKWTKVWRENSTSPDEEIVYINGSQFTSNFKSSYYKWLKKIRFKYVPAIKSQEYFNQLMFDLYDVLQKDTNSLEIEFNRQVGEKTSQISNQISKRLNLENVLQFKGTFRDLFNTLEFGTVDGKIMLDQRGDGVKVRHIPVILQNMAEAELREERKREPIANTIWGFEEPENNLEFDSAKKLADQFIEYLDKINFQDVSHKKYDEGVQIFISTHSPIFYTLGSSSEDKASTFFVSKARDESSNIRVIDHKQSILLEKEMKLLPLIELSKHWKNVNNEMDAIRKENEELEKIKEQFTNTKKCIVLTEDKKKGLFETLLLANGFIKGEYDLSSYNGCSKIGSAEVLYNYLKDKFDDTCPPLLIHRDKDYMNPKDIQADKIKYRKKGLELFITMGTDVESYFTKVAHIKQCHPELSEEVITEFRERALAANKDQAIEAMKRNEYGEKYASKNTFLMDKLPEYYNENEEVLFHGKKVFKNLKAQIQEATGKNSNLEIQSDHLVDNSLREFANKIWKKTVPNREDGVVP